MSSDYGSMVRNAFLVATVESQLFSDLVFTKKRSREYGNDGSIVIVGGELFNKGAQAMTFTVVDQMTKRYPEKDIYLFSGRDYERDIDEKEEYEFEILPWDAELQLALLSSSLDEVNTSKYQKEDREKVRSIFENCDMLIDINGFALSSRMNLKGSFAYLVNILLAKEYDIPMYILPQSMGPFNYPTRIKPIINPLMQTYLTYPKIVCPREKAGIEFLAPYTKNNVQREFDIVLQTERYELDNIYTSEPDLEHKEIESNAVGIVPNSRVFDHADDESIYSLYDAAIETLLNADRTVYVFRHSTEDLDICRRIKSRFSETENVLLFENDFNAPDLEYIIKQCDFLIASRYHSIVHAYKHAVPVVGIGWAVKYEELLDEFGQSAYFFEGRKQIDVDAFVSSIKQMNEQWENESSGIQEKIDTVQQNNLFSRLFTDTQ